MADEAVVLIRLDGIFDAPAAFAVCGRLGAAAAGSRVVIDFSQVTKFDDRGVAVMAASLGAEKGPRVFVRGLRQHQHRIFRYLGVDLDHSQGVSQGSFESA
ncbi:MAG TPA: STAS domain-containing protein [Anaeromyxobacteraceae bacterium]|nr:STAS domain-containing protein [Anaeromyxobacteraceae bacterium]